MKTIGLIGGMNWESSLIYYQTINYEVKQRLGGVHSGKSLMYSVDFGEIDKLQNHGDWKKITDIMVEAARSVERGGADMLLICTNSMHQVAEDIEANINIPLIHIADATGAKIKERSLRKVGLLGTQYTMEQDFFKKRLEKNYGIKVIVPDTDDRETIHNIIYGELVLGVVNESSKSRYKNIIHNLVNDGAEGIILGCTDIPLLVNQKDYKVRLFDTTIIHAKAAVEFALRDE